MDRFEGRCHLDWWANSSLNLAGNAVRVVITSGDDGWHAQGHLIDDSETAREGFAFLCDLDPVFDLRFADGSTIAVDVHPLDGHRRFTLGEHTGPATPIDYRFDLGAAPAGHQAAEQ